VKILIEKQTRSKMNSYNLAMSRTKTVYEISHKIKACYEKRYGRNIDIVSLSGEKLNYSNPKNRYTISNEKLKKLGFRPEVAINYGINQVFEYLEKVTDV
jgi:uncharacterized protein (DUF1697 family)